MDGQYVGAAERRTRVVATSSRICTNDLRKRNKFPGCYYPPPQVIWYQPLRLVSTTPERLFIVREGVPNNFVSHINSHRGKAMPAIRLQYCSVRRPIDSATGIGYLVSSTGNDFPRQADSTSPHANDSRSSLVQMTMASGQGEDPYHRKKNQDGLVTAAIQCEQTCALAPA